MTKTEYLKDLRRVFGDRGFISQGKIEIYLHRGSKATREFLQPLTPMRLAGSERKVYAMADVAELLAEAECI